MDARVLVSFALTHYTTSWSERHSRASGNPNDTSTDARALSVAINWETRNCTAAGSE